MRPRLDPSEMPQRHAEANRAVAAHPQRSDVVEEDHPRRTRRIDRFAQQGPDDHIRPARLIDHRRAKLVKPLLEDKPPLGHRTAPEIRSARDDNPRRLAPGVRVDDLNATDGV